MRTIRKLKTQKENCEEKQQCVFSNFASAVDDVGMIRKSAF
jgi:hypothetical protein